MTSRLATTATSAPSARSGLATAGLLALGAAGLGAAAAGALCAYRRLAAKRAAAAKTAAAKATPSPSSSSSPLPYTLLLFDIEGTTTPISFVKDTLFPFVVTQLRDYLITTYSSPQTQSDIQALIELSEQDEMGGKEGVVTIPRWKGEGEEVNAFFQQQQIEAVVRNVAWQMASDRKSTPLKALQGHMWKGGYESGQLKGQLFGGAEGDVAQMLQRWAAAGYQLGVYSSGSVGAQKLLFGHSEAGDLTPLFSCNFDTTVGMKQESTSYANIAKAVGLEHTPERILFFTDIWGEAWAAHQAGVHAVIMDRPGNYDLPAEQHEKYTFPLAKDFFEVQSMLEQKAEGKGPLQQLQQEKKAEAAPKQEASESQVDTSSGQYNTF